MAQEAHCWTIRKDPTIRAVFETYFNEKCCVSIDGAAALFAPSTSKLPLHVDLVPNLEGSDWNSVQGSFNVFDVIVDGPRMGAGFVCVPGSHSGYDARWEARTCTPKKHRFVLENESPLQNEAVLVASPANSLILWQSKLLHSNYGGDFTHSELGGRLPRLTQFVCWQPVKWRTEAMLAKKRRNVKDGCCGNHWAALGVREAIKPFPAWGPHPIHIIVPFFGVPIPEDIDALL